MNEIENLQNQLKICEKNANDLKGALLFFASVIKSGEPWTDFCQQVLDRWTINVK